MLKRITIALAAGLFLVILSLSIRAQKDVTVPSSTTSVSLYKRGMALYASGSYGEAAVAFKEAVRLNPDDSLSYNSLGLTYFALSQYDKAAKAFNKAIDLRRDLVGAESWYKLGVAYTKLHQNGEAIEALEQATYIIRAQGIIDKGTKRQEYKRVLAEIHNSLGVAYFNEKRYHEAVEAYQQAINLDSNLAVAHYSLGITYCALKEIGEAEKQHKILKTLDVDLAKKLANRINILRSWPTRNFSSGNP